MMLRLINLNSTANLLIDVYFLSFHFQKGMLVFDVAQFDGILKKIIEFNNSLLSDPVGCFTIVSFKCHHCDFHFFIFSFLKYLLSIF